ncbi:MAG TPA: hypothetical protein EYP22_04295, partial [Methanosarcinales archaeon]|nr:hypothetical protein [Methanosarcinales archaeon]
SVVGRGCGLQIADCRLRIADIIVGAYGNDSTTGAVYVYNKTTTDKSYNITLQNPNGTFPDYFGYSVASGDVNKDGIADIIVGAYKTDSYGNNDTGKVYVYYGNNNSIETNPNVTILDPHNRTNDYFGYSVASGDVNKDGIADIIASAIGVDNGTVYIYYGNTELNKTLNTPNVTLFNPSNTSDSFFGISISSGDVNKDGFTDVIVGANKSNKVYIFFGPITSNRYIANVTLKGTSGDNFGISTAVGDINNDDANDVIVGADGNDSIHIYYGGTSLNGTISDANLTILNPSASNFGYSVSYAGDIDSDGYGDVVVGAPYANSKKGMAYVYRGGLQTGIDSISTDDYNLSVSNSKYFGTSTSVGDVDNDGYPDVIIGANGVNNSEGAVYVFTPRFPEYPWLGVGNTTEWTTVWHYYSVIKDDNGIGNGSYIEYNASQTFNKTLSIYRSIKTDITLSMNVSSETDAKVIVSVNGIGVNDTSPPINTSGIPMWWNITLPGDISEWNIGNNTVAIKVITGNVKVYPDENNKLMIRLSLPIDQPLDSTETTPDFADALNEYMATHNESEDGTADNNYTIPFILHSNSTGKLKLSNLRIRSTPQLDENLDKLLPDHVNYNVIFAYLDTLRRDHLYNFSSGNFTEILEYDSAGNKTVNITLPNESIVYSAKMDISGLPLYKGFEI